MKLGEGKESLEFYLKWYKTEYNTDVTLGEIDVIDTKMVDRAVEGRLLAAEQEGDHEAKDGDIYWSNDTDCHMIYKLDQWREMGPADVALMNQQLAWAHHHIKHLEERVKKYEIEITDPKNLTELDLFFKQRGLQSAVSNWSVEYPHLGECEAELSIQGFMFNIDTAKVVTADAADADDGEVEEEPVEDDTDKDWENKQFERSYDKTMKDVFKDGN